MSRYPNCIAFALLVCASTSTFAKGKANLDASWGKAGVSFEDYRADSQECARLGANSDMTKTEAAKTIIRGIDRQDTDIMEGINPFTVREYMFTGARSRFKENVKRTQSNMINIVLYCLRKKGYTEFGLNDQQMIKLSGLKQGSEDRFRYLHSLASRKEIVDAQKIVDK